MSKHYVACSEGVRVYEGATPKEAKRKAIASMLGCPECGRSQRYRFGFILLKCECGNSLFKEFERGAA